jgi:hypothetical protein
VAAEVGVDLPVVPVVPVVAGVVVWMNGKVTVSGEVWTVGVVVAFLIFLVGLVVEEDVVGACAVVEEVVGGGGSCTGSCGTVVVVLFTWGCDTFFRESPTRDCPTATGA